VEFDEYVVHLIKPDGWEYDITLRLPREAARVASDVSQSPPGKSRFVVNVEPLQVAVTGTISGREAPELRFPEIAYVWEKPLTGTTWAPGGVCSVDGLGNIRQVIPLEMPLICDTIPRALGTNLDNIEPDYMTYLDSAIEGDEADVVAYVDYVHANMAPDWLIVTVAEPCTFGLHRSGKVVLITDAVYSGFGGSNEGCEVTIRG